EYILMLVGAIIVAIVILVFLFKTGGTASKNNGLQPELIAAEQLEPSYSFTIVIATNRPLTNYIPNSFSALYFNGHKNAEGKFFLTNYTVPGGYEYEISGKIPPSISSITYITTTGQTVTILPESGSSVPITPGGTFPFTITQIT
ncbi:MAG: hypothetical protein QXU98_14420, partial [Candidatus Parvarchaeota archaeon]